MAEQHTVRGIGVLLAALGVGFVMPAYLSYTSSPAPARQYRDNERWRDALSPYPGRYEQLDPTQVRELQKRELRYRELMDGLTAVDGRGGDHGKHHVTKRDREQELWMLLQALPRYPALPRMLLAAMDDVYLGYHGNGWWGAWWHWPYLDCAKAIALADRLERDYPEMEEEALWTKIYCYRVEGGQNWDPREAQEPWQADVGRARALGEDLLKKHPKGKYATRVTALLAEKDLNLVLPHYPVMGRTPSGLGGRSHTERSYSGPEFLIDRSVR